MFRQLVTACENVLVKAHIDLLQEEFQRLLEQDKEEDLNRMYNLLHRIPDGLDPLRARFEEFVKRVGLNAVERVVTEDKEPVRLASFVFVEAGEKQSVLTIRQNGRNRNHTSRHCSKCTRRMQIQSRRRSEEILRLLHRWTRYESPPGVDT